MISKKEKKWASRATREFALFRKRTHKSAVINKLAEKSDGHLALTINLLPDNSKIAFCYFPQNTNYLNNWYTTFTKFGGMKKRSA